MIKATEIVSQGYHYAVDIDLERFLIPSITPR